MRQRFLVQKEGKMRSLASYRAFMLYDRERFDSKSQIVLMNSYLLVSLILPIYE